MLLLFELRFAKVQIFRIIGTKKINYEIKKYKILKLNMLQTTKNLNSSYEKFGDTKLGTKIWENTDGRTTLALASRRPLRRAAVNAIYIIYK